MKLAAGGAKNGGQSRIRTNNAGHISESAWLIAEVVDRVFASSRVLDPDRVVKKFAGCVVIDLADGAAELDARLNPRLLAAIERDRAAGGERSGLGLDVDDAGSAQPILRRQSSGDQRYGIGEPRLE